MTRSPLRSAVGPSAQFTIESPKPEVDLSIVIPALDEEATIALVVEGVRRVCAGMGIDYEVLVVDGGSADATLENAEAAGARVLRQSRPGYGAALREAFAQARGRHIATMDSDLSHPPDVLRVLHRDCEVADLLIASRFRRGGLAVMPLHRRVLSRVLNGVFSRILDIPVADLSSGFRLYRREMLRDLEVRNDDFSFLQEILVAAYNQGYAVYEVPFHYQPRQHGRSKARIVAFGISYLRLLGRSRRLRASAESADYDERAFYSWVLPQRWWQRWRYRIVTRWADRVGCVVDVGCGASRILEALPGAIGLDFDPRKLRYRRPLGNPLVCARIEQLPIASASCDQVICSQLIEHVPEDPRIFSELARVLKPGGSLILGTPDYARWQWRLVEWIYARVLPGAYADQHITHYTFDSLSRILDAHGFELLEHRYVFQGELILRARKRDPQEVSSEHASLGETRESCASPSSSRSWSSRCSLAVRLLKSRPRRRVQRSPKRSPEATVGRRWVNWRRCGTPCPTRRTPCSRSRPSRCAPAMRRARGGSWKRGSRGSRSVRTSGSRWPGSRWGWATRVWLASRRSRSRRIQSTTSPP
jgi:glycosyltransferase involved in cell wall biosynthesis/predicted SAM-dependent methyltransferase